MSGLARVKGFRFPCRQRLHDTCTVIRRRRGGGRVDPVNFVLDYTPPVHCVIDPPPLPTHRTPLFRRGSSGGCRTSYIYHGEEFPMRFTARPRVGGRRAVGRWHLCVCCCQKVVRVSIDLTCFYWEVFWGRTSSWEVQVKSIQKQQTRF